MNSKNLKTPLLNQSRNLNITPTNNPEKSFVFDDDNDLENKSQF